VSRPLSSPDPRDTAHPRPAGPRGSADARPRHRHPRSTPCQSTPGQLPTPLTALDGSPQELPLGFATEQVHGGEDAETGFGARVTPVHLTAGFVFDSFAHARARFAGDDDGYTYTRVGNPTVAALERRLARLEGGAESIVLGSGQAAVSVALLSLLQAGDRLLTSGAVYEGTRGLFRENFARFGIEVDVVEDPSDLDAWRALVRPTTGRCSGRP
jgi:O-acetylhomoserine (thiol)-lyase